MRPSPRRFNIVFVLLLTLATITVYARTFGYGYIILDDLQYVYQNSVVRQGFSLAGVKWAFTTFSCANWHPLTWLSLMLDCQIFGRYPGEEHAVNVFLHLASSLLLYAALLKMTGRPWRCALVAAIFALHPLHVESVAWISERKDVLCAFFEMIALVFYARYVERPGWRRYAPVAFAFALALLSKPMAVTFPLLLMLLDFWPLRRIEWPLRLPVIGKLLREKAPLLALCVPASVLTFLAQRDYGAMVSLQRFGLAMRAENSAIAYVKYLGKTLIPVKLAVLYPIQRPDLVAAAGSILLLAALTFGAVRYAKRWPYLLAGWLWFLGSLVPVIGLVQVGVQSMADRYMYVPIIGLSFAAVWWAADAVEAHPEGRRQVTIFAMLGLAVCLGLALDQVGYWCNSTTLLTRAYKVTKDNYKVENDLGLAFALDGDAGHAIWLYKRALAHSPDWPEALTNLGTVLLSTRRFNDAIIPLERAVRLDPGYALAQAELGAALGALERFDEARPYLERALRLQPNDAKTQSNLCYTLQRLERLDEAAPHCLVALRLDPGYEDARFNLGRVLAAQGRKAEAAAEFSRLLAANPNHAGARAALRQIQ